MKLDKERKELSMDVEAIEKKTSDAELLFLREEAHSSSLKSAVADLESDQCHLKTTIHFEESQISDTCCNIQAIEDKLRQEKAYQSYLSQCLDRSKRAKIFHQQYRQSLFELMPQFRKTQSLQKTLEQTKEELLRIQNAQMESIIAQTVAETVDMKEQAQALEFESKKLENVIEALFSQPLLIEEEHQQKLDLLKSNLIRLQNEDPTQIPNLSKACQVLEKTRNEIMIENRQLRQELNEEKRRKQQKLRFKP